MCVDSVLESTKLDCKPCGCCLTGDCQRAFHAEGNLLSRHLLRNLRAVVFAAILAAMSFSTAFAALTQTITANVDVTIPFVNKSALGTIVLMETGTPDHIVGNWSFTGQVNGKLASAAGVYVGQYTGSSYVGQVTAISDWNVPGVGRPQLPLTLTLSSTSGVINFDIITHHHGTLGIPLAVQGVRGLPPPFQGNLTLSITNAVLSGPVQQLPRTGAVPEWYDLAALAMIGFGCLALATSRTALRRLG